MRFGIAWVAFALSLAVHVADEATHDFLATYNPTVRWLRAQLPFLPLPTFTFALWLPLLIAVIALLLCLSPCAFRGNSILRHLALPLAVVVGLCNGLGHLGASLYMHRWMAGIYSAPLLIVTALWLLSATGWIGRRAFKGGTTAPR
jgi:hypothetical protein